MSLAERVRAARLPSPDLRRTIRESAGVSLADVGDELGVSNVTVMRWERGLACPTRDHAIAYRELLDALREATR